MRRWPSDEQVPRRGQAAVPVRRPDRRRVVERFAGRVDDDVRDAPRRELVLHRLAEVGEDGDDAGRPASEDALDPAATRRPPALHLAEDDREVMLAGDALDAADDLERPLALELVEDHLEERRPAARPGRSLVAVLADRGLDPAPRLGGHVRPPVDHLRDGRHRDAGHLRDVRHGRRIATDRGASGWATSRPQCSELDRATKVSRARLRQDHEPAGRSRPVWRID